MYFEYHKESVRGIDFSPDGNMIYTASADKSIAVITNGNMAGQIEDAHPEAIHSLIHLDGGNLLATGDDDGLIRIWDLR